MLYFVIYAYIILLVILYTDIPTLSSHTSPTLNYAEIITYLENSQDAKQALQKMATPPILLTTIICIIDSRPP